MFIAEPHEAFQDVMEINFGFQVASVAGVSVEKIKEDQKAAGKEEGTDPKVGTEEVKTNE